MQTSFNWLIFNKLQREKQIGNVRVCIFVLPSDKNVYWVINCLGIKQSKLIKSVILTYNTNKVSFFAAFVFSHGAVNIEWVL